MSSTWLVWRFAEAPAARDTIALATLAAGVVGFCAVVVSEVFF